MNRSKLQDVLGDLEPLKEEKIIKVDTSAIEELLALYELELKALSSVRAKNHKQKLAALRKLENENDEKFSGMCIDVNTLLDFISHIKSYFNKYKVSRGFFLQDNSPFAYEVHTGPFITRLINESYKKGGNNFIIPVEYFPIKLDNVCCGLEGRANKLLCVKIIGDVGRTCGGGSKYADITLEGKPDIYFGGEAEDCIFRCTDEWALRAMMSGDDGLPTPVEFFQDINKNCKMYLIKENGEQVCLGTT
ncbi:MAG: hypothetical protein HY438_00770 [DPANN group archaeon]|nr:hypothetical protein [DPANN group archaeon]